jgi:hypothetical protein
VNMKEWIKINLLQSATMWVGALLLVAATGVLVFGEISGEAYLGFLAIDSAIMLGKRAATQAITGAQGEGK